MDTRCGLRYGWMGDAAALRWEKLNMTASNPASLRRLVARSDSHPALVVPESGAALSYAGLQRALDRAAGRLATLGVREGDRVALVAANGPALIVAFLAIVASGAAAAPLSPTSCSTSLRGCASSRGGVTQPARRAAPSSARPLIRTIDLTRPRRRPVSGSGPSGRRPAPSFRRTPSDRASSPAGC